MSHKACCIHITGIVQGVGFRPFVYNLAHSLFLKGRVRNAGADVIIEVEGPQDSLDTFVQRIKSDPPPLSKIKSVDVKSIEFVGYSDFEIETSSRGENGKVYISPDVGVCKDCERELFDAKDRRYLYPFINCTNCGPRFTIIKGVPYDRPLTTMDRFEMCDTCAVEYKNPADRRYHAQPVSCYRCGPRLQLLDSRGETTSSEDIIEDTRRLIAAGYIIAVKGLGGYHLVCDAHNAEAVKRLIKRKIRDDKPFALMVKNYKTAMQYCQINDEEKKLLESERKPIVLLRKREGLKLPEEIAPGNPYLGIMLPYTPVHLLLFHSGTSHLGDARFSALVATSGNRSSEPIYYKDEDAIENLKDIADYFLTNDREIYIRTDDSVTRVALGKEYIIRRARGYVPFPVTCEIFNKGKIPAVLACGGELKNTFCLNKGNEFYISHHIGDLENAETLTSFEQGIEHFQKMFGIEYEAVAYDLHPEYLSTKYAVDLNVKNKIAVQHHQAHIASCMADNDLEGNVIGVAFDGTGYGEDGNLWGGEFFTGSYKGFKRAAHLEYVPMPGGEKAIKEPWRMAVSYLYSLPGPKLEMKELLGFFPEVDEAGISAVHMMIDKKINAPLTSSVGRLFDAVSALLGIRSRIRYEGQAAIELEYAAAKESFEPYHCEINGNEGIFRICTSSIIKSIIEDRRSGVPIPVISSKFHTTVAVMVEKICSLIRQDTGLRRVVLSGGVFQNITLLEQCVRALTNCGFEVYTHSRVPSNDGGISLGQAVMAAAKFMKE